MPKIGTSAELMNVSGKIHVKLAACTVSVSFSVSPIHADTHEKLNPINTVRMTATIACHRPKSNEKPTR